VSATITTPAPGETGVLYHYHPADLVESITNPRKGKVEIGDIVESIRAQGVLEPLLGRRVADQVEVVFGRRRRAAAMAVGLASVPIIIRDVMTDAEVLEAQIVENRDRRDVHPMEEAEGYEALLRIPREDGTPRALEDIAARVGADVRYLTRRLALLKLAPEVREAFAAGRIETSVALLLATLRKVDQVKACGDLAASEDGTRGAVPYRAALDHVRRTYLLRLADAPFTLSAEDLVPGVGACGGCPKRTGSNPNLFGEFEATELCTDPACYAKKVSAGWSRLAQAAKDSGREVLGEKEAADVFRFGATTPSNESPFIDIDDRCFDDPKERTYREILGDALPVTTLARDGQGGVHDLLDRKEARKAVRGALPKQAAAKAEEREAVAAQAAADDREEKIREATYRLALQEFAKKVDDKGLPVRVVAEALLLKARDTRKRWKLDDEGAVFAKLKAPSICRLIVDAALEIVAFDPFMRGEPSRVEDVAATYRVDLKKVRAEAERDIE
jgi:ParB/RepB/Spo0J family partition protein